MADTPHAPEQEAAAAAGVKAAALRQFADQIDAYVPTKRMLWPSVIATMAREKAEQYDELAELPVACRVCGCTDEQACPGGCHWVPDPAGDTCSRCAGAAIRVTVTDLDSGDTSTRGVPAGEYAVVAVDPCHYTIEALPGGVHVITVHDRAPAGEEGRFDDT